MRNTHTHTQKTEMPTLEFVRGGTEEDEEEGRAELTRGLFDIPEQALHEPSLRQLEGRILRLRIRRAHCPGALSLYCPYLLPLSSRISSGQVMLNRDENNIGQNHNSATSGRKVSPPQTRISFYIPSWSRTHRPRSTQVNIAIKETKTETITHSNAVMFTTQNE